MCRLCKCYEFSDKIFMSFLKPANFFTEYLYSIVKMKAVMITNFNFFMNLETIDRFSLNKNFWEGMPELIWAIYCQRF